MIKRLFLLSTALTLILTTNAQQPGRVKITFAGFKCIRETTDDMLQADGKGDEVFFQFYFTMAGSNGSTRLSYANRSDIYGDATGPFSNRISAGSCTDMFGGAKGGIKAGDNFTTSKIIGEYDIAAGDVLTIVPTVWEWDPGQGFESSFDATINGAYTTINQKATNISQNRLGANLPGAGPGLLGYFLLDGGTNLSLQAFFNIVGELGPKSRPIGITTNGNYSPKAVLFNANIMQSIANSNFGYGPGVIPVQYNEEALGNQRDHGNYIILLKVDFTPKPGGATAPPPAPSGNAYVPPPNTTPVKQVVNVPNANLNTKAIASNGTLRTLNTGATPANAAVGTWKGTSGAGFMNTPNFYSIKFNADGTLQLLAANGTVQATGTYTYGNNQVMGRYTYTNNTLNSFAGTLDASGALNGTWGQGASSSGGGKWKMNRE